MRLIQFGAAGEEKPGILSSVGQRKDVSAFFGPWDHEFFRGDGLSRLASFLKSDQAHSLPDVAETVRWGAPVARPGKVVCIGLNYSDHAAETGGKIPKEPILFMKAPNTGIGPYDDVEIPKDSKKTDWEVELGVVIGKDARYVASPEAAMEHVAGYCISNDISEREFQIERGGQWTKGKSCDTFNPLGPWLATRDEVADVGSLRLSLRVNGEVRQNGSSSKMIFGVPHLVWYISQFMTLEPGDLISTGTPSGVGMGMKPPQFLKSGDVMELEIEGLGTQKQKCVPYRPH
jgi:2-keto-4-pentenoate hydratase/2-oxohepta-3-ene-1,7-dioic acid hydratase in catechol pathway